MLKQKISDLVKEAKRNGMVFVFGDEVYTPDEAEDAMMEYAISEIEEECLTEDAYIDRVKACMAEA